MMRPVFAAIVGISLFASVPASAADWIVDGSNSRIGFSGTQTGTPFAERFERTNMTIAVDPAHPEASRIVAAIDLGSARTGDQQRDTALPTADWFDIAHAQTARFETIRISRTGPNA
jgi:polyisoprenoid-binding protein YceI